MPVRSAPEPNAGLVTELVAGETLAALLERDGWLRVVVPGHPSSLDERGYPGWVSSEARLAPAGGWSPDLVVARPNSAGPPLGTLLRREGETGALPGGERMDFAGAGADSVLPLGEPSPMTATALARSLLGLPYRWGGTDSTAGMDCSGLVYRLMQLQGILVPRDSGDQFFGASFRSEAGWQEASPGDLVFFGESTDEGGISHVGFYLGGGEYVSEHGGAQTGCAVIRSVTDDPYQGFARYREPDPREALAGPPPR